MGRAGGGLRRLHDAGSAASTQYELLDATVGQVGPRLQLRWRLHVQRRPLRTRGLRRRAALSTPTPARPAGSSTMSMLCSGFCAEHGRCSETETTWGGWDERRPQRPVPALRRDPWALPGARRAPGRRPRRLARPRPRRRPPGAQRPRLSKDMLAALDDDPDVVDEGLPGPAFARHMLAVDPPDHTRLRGLVARAFAPVADRRAGASPSSASPSELLDELAAGPAPVVDLVRGLRPPAAVPGDRRAARRARGRPARAARRVPHAVPAVERLAAARGRRRLGRRRRLPRAPRRRAPARTRPTTSSACSSTARTTSAHPPGAAVEPVPADRRRARHHDQPDRQRRRRPARPPRPAAPAPRRAAADARARSRSSSASPPRCPTPRSA